MRRIRPAELGTTSRGCRWPQQHQKSITSTEAVDILGENSGFGEKKGDHSAPNPPQDPDPPRSFPRVMRQVARSGSGLGYIRSPAVTGAVMIFPAGARGHCHAWLYRHDGW